MGLGWSGRWARGEWVIHFTDWSNAFFACWTDLWHSMVSWAPSGVTKNLNKETSPQASYNIQSPSFILLKVLEPFLLHIGPQTSSYNQGRTPVVFTLSTAAGTGGWRPLLQKPTWTGFVSFVSRRNELALLPSGFIQLLPLVSLVHTVGAFAGLHLPVFAGMLLRVQYKWTLMSVSPQITWNLY